jgi:hypothetical protein
MMRLMGTAAAMLLGMGLAFSPAQAATCGSVTASACNTNAAIFHDPPDTFPSGLNEQKIFTDNGPATTHNTGNVASQNGFPEVSFDTDVAVRAANGFAQIGVGNDFFHRLTFTIPGHVFGDLMFDTQGLLGGEANNDISISAFLANSLIINFATAGLGAGEQNWLVLGLAGQVFDKVVIESLGGFKKNDHFQVSDVAAIPIPAALPLFGTALIGIAALGMKRRRRA